MGQRGSAIVPRARPALIMVAVVSALAGLIGTADAGFDEGEAVWGDSDCSGEASTADTVPLLAFLATGVSIENDCPSPGETVNVTNGGTTARIWGDANCDGELSPDDILHSLSHFGGIADGNDADCPEIGETVMIESASPQLWYRTDGGPNADESWNVDTDTQGNIYYATHQTVPGPFLDWIIYKLTPEGDEIWQQRWGRDWADQAFEVVVDGPVVYVGGYSQNAFSLDTTQDMALAAFDTASGDLLWDFTWDQGFGYEELDGVVPDGDHIYIAGWTTGEETGNDIAVLKLDSEGNIVWETTYGGEMWDEANGQIVVSEDRVYVAGRVDATSIFFGGNAIIAAFDKETGDTVDEVIWGPDPLIDIALGLTTDGEHLYSIGFTGSQGDGFQLQVRKYTFGLDLVWETLYGGPQNESARVGEIFPGGLLIAGGVGSPGGDSDAALWLLDPATGNVLWQETWGGPEYEFAHGLTVHGQSAYITGETRSTGAGETDAFLISGSAPDGELPGFP